MKVIELILFIIISVAAQENEQYHVALTSQIGPRNKSSGYLRITQNGFGNPVQIDGNIWWLPPGRYTFAVHEINENTTNCDSLGPMVDLGFDTLFDLLDEYIDFSRTGRFTKVTRALTLEPNRPRTLVGRAIAFFQEPILGVDRNSRRVHSTVNHDIINGGLHMTRITTRVTSGSDIEMLMLMAKR